jgi:hypothetical protein
MHLNPDDFTNMRRSISRRLALTHAGGLAGALLLPAALRAETPALYDAQPPADSAYLRLLLTAGASPAQVWVDDRLRLPSLAPLQPSDYLVLAAGKHSVRLKAGAAMAQFAVGAIAGRASTAAFSAVEPKAAPQILEDKTGSNRLKALITAYHFAPLGGPVDILTADGSAKVFANLGPGQSASLAVNPVAVELIVTRAGDKAPLARMQLQLSAGGATSLVLTPASGTGIAAAAHANRVERYSAP